ncbi:hypothetical protein ACLE20_05260 [Rhizobium sp. YIM 134829]|uniref:hypothetical protein n=1 Tax=Rhizobium sp. YIM 134829 TaxID=3390453 RepID=UPI00397BBAAA
MPRKVASRSAADPHAAETREHGGFLSNLNPLETLVIAAIILVALGGALLVGKGLMLKSRIDSASGTTPQMLAFLDR